MNEELMEERITQKISNLVEEKMMSASLEKEQTFSKIDDIFKSLKITIDGRINKEISYIRDLFLLLIEESIKSLEERINKRFCEKEGYKRNIDLISEEMFSPTEIINAFVVHISNNGNKPMRIDQITEILKDNMESKD